MMHALSALAIAVGAAFFLAGTVGLLRFPDTFCRMHALTKADNLGLGFIALGVVLHSPDPFTAIKVLLVWLIALASSSTACYLVAGNTPASEPPVAGHGD
jgi:multicomponent Na+:H+ antiporter subunit G